MSPTVGMKTFLKSKDRLQFEGLINNKLGIHMELQVTNNPFSSFEENNFSSALLMNVDDKNLTKYEGNYYYDAHKENIRVEATLYSSGYISVPSSIKIISLMGHSEGSRPTKASQVCGATKTVNSLIPSI